MWPAITTPRQYFQFVTTDASMNFNYLYIAIWKYLSRQLQQCIPRHTFDTVDVISIAQSICLYKKYHARKAYTIFHILKQLDKFLIINDRIAIL